MWYVNSIGFIKSPRGVTLNGVQHPRNIFTLWSKEELAAIGVKRASIAAVDHRYVRTGEITWDTSGDEAVGTHSTTAISVDELKADRVKSVRGYASTELSRSDWYSIRELDGGTAAPADWKTHRSAVRVRSNEKESEINALADLDAVKAYDSAVNEAAALGDNGWPNAPDYVAP
tara:strand:- start:117 stop:638 length:522 start_codon:yes stop_codon:yes gene_type:complete